MATVKSPLKQKRNKISSRSRTSADCMREDIDDDNLAQIVTEDLIKTDESESGMNYKTLYDVDYFFRIMTKSIFESGNKTVVFDVILPDSDPKLKYF